jgi:hypothetical protein
MRLFFVVRMPHISERSFFFRENPFSYRLGNGAAHSPGYGSCDAGGRVPFLLDQMDSVIGVWA